MSDVILQAKGLSKHFALGEQQVDVLRDINLEIHRGEHVAIVGSSGSGKSTLLHCLGGLDAPSAGSVSLLNRPFDDLPEVQRSAVRNRHLGFIYQFHHLLPEFTALENVSMPLLIRGDSVQAATAKAWRYWSVLAYLDVQHTSRLSYQVVSVSVWQLHVL